MGLDFIKDIYGFILDVDLMLLGGVFVLNVVEWRKVGVVVVGVGLVLFSKVVIEGYDSVIKIVK